MAANPFLSAAEVAEILKESASGHGSWTPTLGYGVLDVAAAVALAQGRPSVSLTGVKEHGWVRLSWFAQGAARLRLSMSVDGGSSHVLLDATSVTTATHTLRSGRHYVFTLTALDTTATSVFSVRG
jgi:hypothetical protein